MEPTHTHTLLVGQTCWFARTPTVNIWDEGIINTISEQTITLLLSDNTSLVVPRVQVYPKNEERQARVMDLVTLHHLSRPAILDVLVQRYSKSEIYTHSGPILIALNPYKVFPSLYDSIAMDRARKGLGASEPHVYNVAERAYRALRRNGVSQSILVSGESGAGKTETTKHVLSYLSYISSASPSVEIKEGAKVKISTTKSATTKEKVLASTPLLEALGNARTIYNDNSSRFGKFISVYFSETGTISGASIQTYLLEKSRLVKSKPKERNFHIFYQLLRGIPKDKKAKYALLGTPESYVYLKGSETEPSDEEGYKQTLEALNKLGFTAEEQDSFHRILSCILMLGNVEFRDEPKDVAIVDDRYIKVLADFFKTKPDVITTALMQRMVTVTHSMSNTTNAPVGSVYITKLSKVKCEQSRDSLAMLLYSRLMNWVVMKINTALKAPKTELPFIGILDIYGFESFERNGFEQLCINYANEKLQRQFNQQVFTKELEEYKAEGIECSNIAFPDNALVIEAIEGNGSLHGIIHHLDDQCKLTTKASDDALVRALYASNIDKSVLRKAEKQQQSNAFVLCHYADRVTYFAEGFVERNMDFAVDEHLNILKRKECPFSHLADEESTPLPETKTRSGSIRKPGGFRDLKGNTGAFVLTTVVSQFKESLNHLMGMIGQTESHYIRCIKPNGKKLASVVEKELVIRQLSCGGIFETVRIVMAGFPTRMSLSSCIEHYGILAPMEKTVEGLLRRVMGYEEKRYGKKTVLDKNQYRIGKTKVFFAAGVAAKLDFHRVELLRSIVMVQKLWRGIRMRKRYGRLRAGMKAMCSAGKGLIRRREYREMVQKKRERDIPKWQASEKPKSVSVRSSVTASLTSPRDTISPRSATPIPSIAAITQERQVQYEREITELKKSLEEYQRRDVVREKDLGKLEATCLSALEVISKKGDIPTGALGTALASFDSIREQLAQHYGKRIERLEGELREERNRHSSELARAEQAKTLLAEQNRKLLTELEESRKTAPSSANKEIYSTISSNLSTLTQAHVAGAKATVDLIRQVAEIGQKLDSSASAISLIASSVSDLSNNTPGEGAKTAEIQMLSGSVTKLEKQISDMSRALVLVVTPVTEIDKRIRETDTRFRAVSESIGQLESVVYSKQDASVHNKELLSRLKTVEERLVTRIGALEDGKVEQGAIELLRGIKLTLETRYIGEGREERVVEENRERVTLSVLVDELEATDVSIESILKAIRKRETVLIQKYEFERKELVEKLEKRISMLNKANKELSEKLEYNIFRDA